MNIKIVIINKIIANKIPYKWPIVTTIKIFIYGIK